MLKHRMCAGSERICKSRYGVIRSGFFIERWLLLFALLGPFAHANLLGRRFFR